MTRVPAKMMVKKGATLVRISLLGVIIYMAYFIIGHVIPSMRSNITPDSPKRTESPIQQQIENKLLQNMNASFSEILKIAGGEVNTLILSVVDVSYVSFAVNFKKTSSKNLPSQYYHLILCMDKAARKRLQKYDIFCHTIEEKMSLDEGNFGTAEYNYKTNLKTKIVIQILKLNLSVLVLDLDTIVYSDPFKHFTCDDCDIHCQRDRVMLNTGCMYVRPTDKSKKLFQTAWELYQRYQKSHDQAYFNMALKTLENQEGTANIAKIQDLPPTVFMSGVNYFEYGNRMFGNRPCKECVVVHNNYMGSIAAKIYRFRENGFWSVDEDQYYSSRTRQYLTYDNPDFFDKDTLATEHRALKTALDISRFLNRTLILPSFHCCLCKSRKCHPLPLCSLLTVLNIRDFHDVYRGLYREHTFLNNTLVPSLYREHKSKTFQVITNSDGKDDKYINLIPKNTTKGVTFEEINTWLSPYKNDPVIKFRSMYFKLFKTKKFYIFEDQFDKMKFMCSEYQQWDPDRAFNSR